MGIEFGLMIYGKKIILIKLPKIFKHVEKIHPGAIETIMIEIGCMNCDMHKIMMNLLFIYYSIVPVLIKIPKSDQQLQPIQKRPESQKLNNNPDTA